MRVTCPNCDAEFGYITDKKRHLKDCIPDYRKRNPSKSNRKNRTGAKV